jgi:hypothetical protein
MARATSLLLVLPNGIKAPGSGNRTHRTPLSDNLRVLTNGEYCALSLLDLDSVIGADDGERVVLTGLCELKEIILDLRGRSAEEQPHLEAFSIYLARVAGLRMFKELDAQPSHASQIVATELDTATGAQCNTFIPSDPWKTQLQAAAMARLPASTPFESNGKARIYALYACDNRWDADFTIPIRNFGVLAFIVENIGTPIGDGATNRDLRICRGFTEALAPLQGRSPVIAVAQASQATGPWTLEVRDDANRITQSLNLPLLPPDPAENFKDARVQQWQQDWSRALGLNEEYTRLRDQAVHRSLCEDGKAYCVHCLGGSCVQSRHVVGQVCTACATWMTPVPGRGMQPMRCRACWQPL